MAHEIAHVAARHATRQMTRANWINIGSIPLIFVGGGVGYAVRAAAGLMVPVSVLHFQRGFEIEADYLGVQYLYESGYDPGAFVSFFEKLQSRETSRPGTLSKAFATHPQTPERIKRSQHEIASILPARSQYLVTSSEFEEVKSRLTALENKRNLSRHLGRGSMPSLRRPTSKDADGNGSGDQQDERPTLKRRERPNQD